MKKHRNPSFPTGLVIGAVLGAGALIYWATRKTTTATLQAMSAQNYLTGEESNAIIAREEARLGRRISREEIAALLVATGRPIAPLIEPNREYLADGSMAYSGTSHPLYNPPQGSTALTPAQIASITANPTQRLTATEQAEILRMRQRAAAAAAAEGRID
jgi:hypothetical protein